MTSVTPVLFAGLFRGVLADVPAGLGIGTLVAFQHSGLGVGDSALGRLAPVLQPAAALVRFTQDSAGIPVAEGLIED